MELAKNDALKLEMFAQNSYHKCECCNRVRDIYFRLNIMDAATNTMVVGSFDLCKSCGENFGRILDSNLKTITEVKKFNFEK